MCGMLLMLLAHPPPHGFNSLTEVCWGYVCRTISERHLEVYVVCCGIGVRGEGSLCGRYVRVFTYYMPSKYIRKRFYV